MSNSRLFSPVNDMRSQVWPRLVSSLTRLHSDFLSAYRHFCPTPSRYSFPTPPPQPWFEWLGSGTALRLRAVGGNRNRNAERVEGVFL